MFFREYIERSWMLPHLHPKRLHAEQPLSWAIGQGLPQPQGTGTPRSQLNILTTDLYVLLKLSCSVVHFGFVNLTRRSFSSQRFPHLWSAAKSALKHALQYMLPTHDTHGCYPEVLIVFWLPFIGAGFCQWISLLVETDQELRQKTPARQSEQR